MDSIGDFLQMVLGFLLQILTLTVHFFIALLQLILQFANTVVNTVR